MTAVTKPSHRHQISRRELQIILERWILAPMLAMSLTMMLVLMMSMEAATA